LQEAKDGQTFEVSQPLPLQPQGLQLLQNFYQNYLYQTQLQQALQQHYVQRVDGILQSAEVQGMPSQSFSPPSEPVQQSYYSGVPAFSKSAPSVQPKTLQAETAVPAQRPQSLQELWEASELVQAAELAGVSQPEENASEPALKRQRVEAPQAALSLNYCGEIPVLDPWGGDRGRLISALSLCGAVFLKDSPGHLPDQNFPKWKELWREATAQQADFRKRQVVQAWQLRFSRGEDLLRTLQGESKTHTPDVRYNFGVGREVLWQAAASWGDIAWIHSDFQKTLTLLAELMHQELSAMVNAEAPGTLGALVASGKESWYGSRLRHSIYPANGSCTEHTDYGVITLQQSSAAGLEAQIKGEWKALQPPDGCHVVFAGDMMERLTNGQVRALRHRVCLPELQTTSSGEIVRQSHILFLQPDRNTIVQPMKAYLRGDGTDLVPIRYGDWHKKKASLAFAR